MEAIIFLVLTIVTAEGHPDHHRMMPEPSIQKCLEDAAAFLAEGLPKGDRGKGAEGLSAECRANALALKADEHS